MANLNVKVSNLGPTGKDIKQFEAASKPLETNIMGINFDTDNDYTVPLKFGDKKVYITPDQAGTMKTLAKKAMSNEKNGNDSVTVSIKGKQYTMSAKDMAKQLQ